VATGRRGDKPSWFREPSVELALVQSFLADLNSESRQAVIDILQPWGARPGVLPFGHERSPSLAILISGQLRECHEDLAGSAMVCRTVAPGRLVGASSLFGSNDDDCWTEAVTPALLARSNAARLACLARANASVAWAVARDFHRSLLDTRRLVLNGAPRTTGQRVARELLDMSEAQHPDPDLGISHENLAESIGSSREVVTRVLGRFSRQGLVILGRRTIQISDGPGLAVAARHDGRQPPARRSR